MNHQTQFADWWTKPLRKRPGHKPGFRRHSQPAANRTEKTCTTCQILKPLAEYHLDARKPDGHYHECKPCRNAKRRHPDPSSRYANRAHGEAHYGAKLTADDVRLILSLVQEREHLLAQAARLTNKVLAEKFEVSASAIDKIANGRAWTRVVA